MKGVFVDFVAFKRKVLVDFRSRCSLSAGRELSLLGLCPVGSQLSRYSRRSRAPAARINTMHEFLNEDKYTYLHILTGAVPLLLTIQRILVDRALAASVFITTISAKEPLKKGQKKTGKGMSLFQSHLVIPAPGKTSRYHQAWHSLP